MLACDIRIAHEDAKVGQTELYLGIMSGGGATQRLPRFIGEGQAMKHILSDEVIDATAAADIGNEGIDAFFEDRDPEWSGR